MSKTDLKGFKRLFSVLLEACDFRNILDPFIDWGFD
jgi:hypothetical protein